MAEVTTDDIKSFEDLPSFGEISGSDILVGTDVSEAVDKNASFEQIADFSVKNAKDTAPANHWEPPSFYIADGYRIAVEALSGGRMTVLYDSSGNPSIMCIIPKFNIEDVLTDCGTGVHPAFIKGGTELSELFIGAYQATLAGECACSLPGRVPAVSINFDDSKAACTSKGSGWHLMTNWEWSAIALWCAKNGLQPRGNTNYGRSYDAVSESGVREDRAAPGLTTGTPRTLTGSGPVTWRHDHTSYGIADLVGNVWERVDGFKLVDGLIYMPDDNNYDLTEVNWPSQSVYFDSDGTTGTDETSDNNGSPILSDARTIPSDDCGDGLGSSAPDYDYTYTNPADNMSCSSGYDSISLSIRQRLVHALVSPRISSSGDVRYDLKGACWCRNYGERVPLRGGDWGNGSNAGLAAFYLNYRRSAANSYFGFRVAFGS
jgi:hypothetical protein